MTLSEKHNHFENIARGMHQSMREDMLDRGKLKESDFRKIDGGAAPPAPPMAHESSNFTRGNHGSADGGVPNAQNGNQSALRHNTSGTNGSGYGASGSFLGSGSASAVGGTMGKF